MDDFCECYRGDLVMTGLKVRASPCSEGAGRYVNDVSWLHHLVRFGSVETVRLALLFGEDVDTGHATLCTPLMLACAQGRLDVMDVLLEVRTKLCPFAVT